MVYSKRIAIFAVEKKKMTRKSVGSPLPSTFCKSLTSLGEILA